MDDKIIMDFTVKNHYLSSTVTASYNTDSHRIEIDYISDNHRGLESSSWFIREVEGVVSQTGRDYDMTFGGFRIHVEDGRLIIGDVGYVSVIFSKDVFKDDSYEYRVDFENKKLIMDVLLSSTMCFARFML